MTWEEAKLMLQLWAEERVGAKSRRDLLEAKAIEDAAATGLAAAAGR